MKQIDAEPNAYRRVHALVDKSTHAKWCVGSAIAVILALIFSGYVDLGWGIFFALVSMFICGKSYARWAEGPEPVFLPGAGRIALSWVAWATIAVVVGLLLSPVGDFGHWLSCNYITGSCRPQ